MVKPCVRVLLLLVPLVAGCGDDVAPGVVDAAKGNDLAVADLALPPDGLAPPDALGDLLVGPDVATTSCSDGVKNGVETDVDCGGNCDRCTDGRGCAKAEDCGSAVCASGTCQVASCSDKVKNGDETDVDCGAGCATRCGTGKNCLQASDCGSLVCTNGVCVDASCSDSVKNGNETDADCGGSCPKCGNGKACRAAVDCEGGVCAAGKCSAPSCTDGAKNGDETDVDCGGKCATKCADGKDCASGADCTSGACVTNVCAQAGCTDKVKNGDETDVDCGGKCPGCGDGKACAKADDCASLVCTGGKCAAATCTDKVMNGTESDVDCGGPTCDKCATGKKCSGAADCASAVCTSGTCAAPTCTDGAKNASESDIDCGGGTCPGCGGGKKCGTAADCAYSNCTGGTCEPGVDSYVKLLLHFDGAGSTFVDSSPTPKTLTVGGGATQSVADSKFGGGSGKFNGATDFLSLPASTDWDFGTGDFTIDLWFKVGSVAGYQGFFCSGGENSVEGVFMGLANNRYYFQSLNIASNIFRGTEDLNGAWHHVAAARKSGIVYHFIDGKLLGSTPLSVSMNRSYGPWISAVWPGPSGGYLNGYIDEYRLSKGIARWTTNFTPPTAPYR